MIRFSVVGVSNTLLDLGLYAAFTRGIAFLGRFYLLANLGSFVVTTLWSFYWNRRWSFRVRGGSLRAQYIKFIIISAVGLGLSELVLWTSVDFFHLHDLAGKLLTIPVVFLWNFTMHALWTFRGHLPIAEPAER